MVYSNLCIVPRSALRIFTAPGKETGVYCAPAFFIQRLLYVVKVIFVFDCQQREERRAKMPRTADVRLEGRILDAAYQLWSRGGERALTMRAVARTARTTTPTLYQRFRDKKDILDLLKKSLADRLGGTLEQHAGLALALAALLHGTATLLLTKGVPERISRELRHACVAAFETLVENAAGRSFRPNYKRAARP